MLNLKTALIICQPDTRPALVELIGQLGWSCCAFDSAQAAAESDQLGTASCVFVDSLILEFGPLKLHRLIQANHASTIAVTPNSDEAASSLWEVCPTCVLAWPTNTHALETCLKYARHVTELKRERAQQLNDVNRRLGRLTDREQDVLNLLTTGKTVKQVAAALEISSKTVSIHRRHVLTKMGVETDSALVRLVSPILPPFVEQDA